MDKYEYEEETYHRWQSPMLSWIEWLDKKGDDGWQLVHVDQRLREERVCTFARKVVTT